MGHDRHEAVADQSFDRQRRELAVIPLLLYEKKHIDRLLRKRLRETEKEGTPGFSHNLSRGRWSAARRGWGGRTFRTAVAMEVDRVGASWSGLLSPRAGRGSGRENKRLDNRSSGSIGVTLIASRSAILRKQESGKVGLQMR